MMPIAELEYEAHAASPLRKAIAARMSAATREIPHFRLSCRLEMDAALEARRRLQAQRSSPHLTINDVVVKLVAQAIADVPVVNCQWVDGEIRQFRNADISIVTAVPGGLSAPILKNAGCKSIWEISTEIEDLIGRAKSGALRVEELVGGSFGLSNLGASGVEQFDAIINPPQCAIMAVGSLVRALLPSTNGEVRLATMACFTLSLDHRALDGQTGALFMSALRRRVEIPDLEFQTA